MPTIAGNVFNTEAEIVEHLQSGVISPLRDATEIRKILNVSTELDELDLNTFWDTYLQDPRFSYALSIEGQNRQQTIRVKRNQQETPIMATGLGFNPTEWARLKQSLRGFGDRTRLVGETIAEMEDIVGILGGAGVAGIHSDVTAATGTTSVTTMDNIHATLAGFFDDIDDNYKFNASNSPIKLVLNRDVAKTARTKKDTSGSDTIDGLSYIKQFVKNQGGAGSGVVVSRMLGGAVAYTPTRQYTITAGTGKMLAIVDKSDVSEVQASPLRPLRNKELDEEWSGAQYRWQQRFVRVDKDRKTEGSVYGTITLV